MTALRKWVEQRFSKAELYTSDLHGYQREAEAFMIANPFSALFIDTGLGKTGASLKLIHNLVTNADCGNVLVIAPLRVATVTWPDEIAKWAFSCFLDHTVIRDDTLTNAINNAGRAKRQEAKRSGLSENVVKAMVEDARYAAARTAVRGMMVDRPAHIYLINKEAVEFLVDAFGKDWPFDTIIIDESSSLKDHTTKRWKALWKVRKLVKRMHQLTATPTVEGYIHLFAQITLLDGGERLGKNFNIYAKRYFTQNKYTFKWDMREGAEEEITAKISDICLVMKEKDYLDTQEPVFSYHDVHLTEGQMSLYRSMERDFIVELPDGTEVEAETAAAMQQKLTQIASGVVYEQILEERDDGTFRSTRVVHHIHDEKIEALRQLREEINGESMLVAYWHQSSLDRILKAFPDAMVMDKKGALIKKWNAGKIPMLLLHPQSGAHGLNLQKGGRHCVWFDMTWSEELHYQFWRRLARQGQKLLVIVHYLVARGTVDELIIEGLKGKRDMQEEFFKMINRLRSRLQRARRKAAESRPFPSEEL